LESDDESCGMLAVVGLSLFVTSVSAPTLIEERVLVEKGRIELDDNMDAWVARTLAQLTFREATLTNDSRHCRPPIDRSQITGALHFFESVTSVITYRG
jgi:PIN domain nuclease of toxin-antitoxin system